MALRFDEHDLANIRNRVDIVQFIESYMPLQKSGANYKALSPFNKEKTPSFVVSPSKQIFHCFSSHKGGDIFTFLMEYENLSFPEAVEKIAEKIGYVFTQNASSSEAAGFKRSEKARLYECLTHTARFYHKTLLTHSHAEAARKYLEKRSIHPVAWKKWCIGYAPSSPNALAQYLMAQGFSQDDMLKVGIVKKDEQAYRVRDYFFNRIMFPILDEQQRTIAFGGRVIGDALPKYINSPETVLYHKSKIMYGLSQARMPIREKKSVFVAEGYFDVIRLHEAGYDTATAPCGTALTDDQIRVLQRYAEQLYVAFDSDQAGINAAMRTMDSILESGVDAFVVSLPDGEDPDSFIQKFGVQAFKEIVDKSEPLLDFRLKVLRKQFGGSERGKIKIAQSMMDIISRQKNSLLAETWVKRMSEELGFSQQVLRGELIKLHKKDEKYSHTPDKPVLAVPDMQIPVWEEELLRILLHGRENLIETAKKVLNEELFMSIIIRRLWSKLAVIDKNQSLKTAEFLIDSYRDDKKIVALISRLSADKINDDDLEIKFNSVVARLKKEFIERKIEEYSTLLKESKGEYSYIFKQLSELIEQKKQLGFTGGF